VLGIADADSAENNSGSKSVIIYPVACAVPDRKRMRPKLSGKVPEIRIRPGSYLHSFYKKDVVTEEFFCNFEVNPEFEGAILEAGSPSLPAGRKARYAPSSLPPTASLSQLYFSPVVVEAGETPSGHR